MYIQPEDMEEGKTYAMVYTDAENIVSSVSILTTKTSVSHVFQDEWCSEAEQPWYTQVWQVPSHVLSRLSNIQEIRRDNYELDQ